MIPLTLAEVAEAVHGQLAGADPAAVVSGPVVVDSREVAAGSLFVAMIGEHTDGHEHVTDALQRGATAALVARPVTGAAVVVTDPAAALGLLATAVLRRTTTCDVVGITGSSGKTSTKDLVAAVLSRHGETVAPPGSFNNEIGLPLTALRVTEQTRHLVLEYSTRGLGHIAYLTGIAQPSVAVVLNVGSAHLSELGSREAIATAKGELVEALPGDGLAVLCADDDLVMSMRARTAAPVIRFGRHRDAEVRIEELELDDAAHPSFRLVTPWGDADVRLGLTGAHNAGNAAAAAAVGLHAGLSLDAVVAALAEARPVSAHRMQVGRRDDGLVVIDDAYNANPESMRTGIDALQRLADGRRGRSWAVVGEMRELGPDSGELHREVGRYAAVAGVDVILGVGAGGSTIVEGASEQLGGAQRAETVADVAAAVAMLTAELDADDTVLVKASNALGLWTVAEALLSGHARTPARSGR
ncbi:MAG TPA: UDP-N-acetylmuramoyl-tripeptide--D-alanyl-D-alanine ligase [Mycobacteriales bacterium]|nr:UDP-N-acetylmuramoyl-tripeptide--D-alanyl-D-alanine ligase [Mycobacteriales bacterium]